MALLWRCAVMTHARRVPVQRAQRRACLGAVALDGEQIVGAVDVDNRAFGVVGGVQRIEGNQAPAHVDILQQRLRGGNLAALVTAAAAGERAPVVGDQRDRLEVHARAAMAVGAADALAVGGERGRLGAVGHRTRRGPTPQHLGQGVGVAPRPQRAHEHLLGHAVRVGIGTVVARESLRAPHPHPVRGVVGAAMEARRIHKRLRQLQRMSVPRLPIRAHTPKTAPQHPRRQVPNPLRPGQNQKPRVVPNQMQAPKLHRPMPAHPPLARGALERSRLPPQQRQPLPTPHCNVAQPPARKLAKPQVVVQVHERVPAPPLIGAGEPHLDLTDHHLRLVERIPPCLRHRRCAQK